MTRNDLNHPALRLTTRDNTSKIYIKLLCPANIIFISSITSLLSLLSNLPTAHRYVISNTQLSTRKLVLNAPQNLISTLPPYPPSNPHTGKQNVFQPHPYPSVLISIPVIKHTVRTSYSRTRVAPVAHIYYGISPTTRLRTYTRQQE
jgi:hypothetical protein